MSQETPDDAFPVHAWLRQACCIEVTDLQLAAQFTVG